MNKENPNKRRKIVYAFFTTGVLYSIGYTLTRKPTDVPLKWKIWSREPGSHETHSPEPSSLSNDSKNTAFYRLRNSHFKLIIDSLR